VPLKTKAAGDVEQNKSVDRNSGFKAFRRVPKAATFEAPVPGSFFDTLARAGLYPCGEGAACAARGRGQLTPKGGGGKGLANSTKHEDAGRKGAGEKRSLLKRESDESEPLPDPWPWLRSSNRHTDPYRDSFAPGCGIGWLWPPGKKPGLMGRRS